MAQPLSVSVDLADLLTIGPAIRAQLYPQLAQAVTNVAEAGVERWQRAVLSAPLWEGEAKAYASTIRMVSTGPMSAEIISDYKYVEDIESGRPAYDLKRMLSTSLKVRVSKKGSRYLIIPFRHNTPGNSAHSSAMSVETYSTVRRLKKSAIVGGGMRMSGTGAWDVKTRSPAMVARRKYLWGDRAPAGLVPKLKTEHKTDPTAGMVRFKNSSGGSMHMTFRVMTEKSNGWIIQPREGLWIARAVATSLQKTAELEFAAAVEAP